MEPDNKRAKIVKPKATAKKTSGPGRAARKRVLSAKALESQGAANCS